MNIIFERFPYRYVDTGVLENGKPDYRIQKADSWTKRYKDMYLLDNEMQLMTALDDFEYTRWLDPDPEVGAYRHYSQSRRDLKSTGRETPNYTQTHKETIMYSKTPYQLRFEIFKQSYNMLQDEFVHYVNLADQKVALDTNDFDYPEPPTLEQVLKQAEVINDFVSETRQVSNFLKIGGAGEDIAACFLVQ